jgi:hypothetical protein
MISFHQQRLKELDVDVYFGIILPKIPGLREVTESQTSNWELTLSSTTCLERSSGAIAKFLQVSGYTLVHPT